MTLTLMPSAEQSLVSYLKTQTDLVAIHGGRVTTFTLPSVLPALKVTRVGGVADDDWCDLPSLQVDCWAADGPTADTLARSVVAALPGLRNKLVTGGKVWTYELLNGPFWAPDDPSVSKNARYILTLSLLLTT